MKNHKKLMIEQKKHGKNKNFNYYSKGNVESRVQNINKISNKIEEVLEKKDGLFFFDQEEKPCTTE